MDKQFWQELRANQYSVPNGASVAQLTEELLSYIGSPDPELRDHIAYETFANWLDKGLYTPEQIRGYIMRLIINLQNGLGEKEGEAVFLRTFSALFLAEIVHHDNKDPFLEKDEVHNVLAKALTYLAEERDPRGFIPGKGWAHSLAHTADLLYVLASNRFLARAELEQILAAITDKITMPTSWVYIHNEDDRLVQAVLAVIQRKLVDEFFYKQWLNSFLYKDGIKRPWKGSFEDPTLHNAYFNTRNFLRSLHLRILQNEKLASRDFLAAEIATTLLALKQF